MAEKRKRHPKKKGSEFESLLRKMQEDGVFKDRDITFGPTEGPKLSEVLLEFIEPFRHTARTDEEFKRLVSVALIAWNMTILPESARKELSDEVLARIDPAGDIEIRKDFEAVITQMVERKERYFSADRRMVISYELKQGKDNFYLNVAHVWLDKQSGSQPE